MGLRENARPSRSIPARVADPLATLTEPVFVTVSDVDP